MVIHSARPQAAGTTQNNPLKTNAPKTQTPPNAYAAPLSDSETSSTTPPERSSKPPDSDPNDTSITKSRFSCRRSAVRAR